MDKIKKVNLSNFKKEIDLKASDKSFNKFSLIKEMADNIVPMIGKKYFVLALLIVYIVLSGLACNVYWIFKLIVGLIKLI